VSRWTSRGAGSQLKERYRPALEHSGAVERERESTHFRYHNLQMAGFLVNELQQVEVRWELDPATHRRGRALVEQYTGRRAKVVSFVLILAVTCAVAFLIVSGRMTAGAMVAAVAVGALGTLAVLLVLVRRAQRKALEVRREAGHSETKTVISERGVEFKSGDARSEMGWAGFKQVSYEDGFFVLLGRSGGGCFIPLDREDPRWPVARALVPEDLWFERPKEPSWN